MPENLKVVGATDTPSETGPIQQYHDATEIDGKTVHIPRVNVNAVLTGGFPAIGETTDETWDGSADASLVAIARYTGLKVEAVRALAALLLTESAFTSRIGEVSATPTANTVQDRLKALLTGIVLAAGENHVGSVGGHTPRVSATLVRPADATQYAIGDLIGNSTTAADVVPITFQGAARLTSGSGRLSGCTCVVSAASGTIVLPAFDLLVFRPATDIPFAAAGYPADNTALNVTAAAMLQLVAVFSFTATAWRNQAGGATAAGLGVYQAVPVSNSRMYAPFNLGGLGSDDLLGLVQAQNTWNPGAIVNWLDFVLDVDQD